MTTTTTPSSRTDIAAAVESPGLVKKFGHAPALDGLDLTVARGSATGFLGPNGAGKSTVLPSSISIATLSIMTLIAVGVAVIAGWLYRRRDVV